MLRDWGQEKRYHHVLKGFNYRMDGMQGAILRVKLRHLEEWTEARRAHAASLSHAARRTASRRGCRPRRRTGATSTTSTRCARGTATRLQQQPAGQGVQTASTIRSRCTSSRRTRISAIAPATSRMSEAAAHEVLSLPMFPELTSAQVEAVAAAVRQEAHVSLTPTAAAPDRHGGARRSEAVADPAFESGLAEALKRSHTAGGLDRALRPLRQRRRDARRADARVHLARRGAPLRPGLQVGSGAGFKHLETFEIGDGVFIGAQAYIQGRFDGTCVIGDHVWIGPQAYFDARDLVLEDYVGWGPGAKVLGSAHTGDAGRRADRQTDLEIKPVRIGAWADIGTNADDPARRHRRQGRDRRRRRGRDAGRRSRLRSSPACRRGSCAGGPTIGVAARTARREDER